MKRNEDSVHISPSAVESVARPLSGSIQSGRVSPTSPMVNAILVGDLRNAANQLQEPSIAASMASFSTSGFVAAANGSTTVTIGPIGTSPPVPFSTTIQTTKASTAGGATQVVAQQQHIFHQSLAHQQARHSLATAAAPAGSPPTGQSTSQQTQQQQQNTMQQAFQQMTAGPHGPGAQQFQRLKVEDALSYLDQVKYKFGNQPQVYNDFLDIMKEFKSQSIDTPGVIARVSSLFRGHPELIVGFNTFLPPGYKIEVQAEQVSVSVPGSLGVPAHIHHITHGPVPITTTTTQQLDVVARSTPPIQQVSITTVPQLTVAAPIQQIPAVAIPVKEVVPTVKATGNSPISNAGSISTAATTYSLGSQQKESSSSPQLGSAAHGYANSSSQGAAAVVNAAFGVPNASQPVEFNHAINYVNKIKNRFQGQPDIYKQFLEILHTYQKEQRSLKEGLVSPLNYRPTLTEAEVYAKVAQLFQNQEDLLQEFGQFLPDATNVTRGGSCGGGLVPVTLPAIPTGHTKKPSPVTETSKPPVLASSNLTGSSVAPPPKAPLKRPAPPPIISSPTVGMNLIPKKKPRLDPGSGKDNSIAEIGKFGTMNELAFFDKVRRVACRSRDVYENFLRCLVMYNQEIISKMELLQITTPFLSRHPDLLKWFKDFLGLKEGTGVGGYFTHVEAQPISLIRSRMEREMYPSTKDGKESRDHDMQAMEIDYSTCKRLGTSYCALPKSYEPPKCSGRTPLCKEVLNETWVSFPTWSSEDSTFVSSRKTQYEEYIYRTEDERYELDIVLETHMSTIRVLEGVLKKLNHRMNAEEANRFKLDDCLGGSSPTIHIRAIRRIYGDKATEIIEGLKRSPQVAIPVVLRRMKAKEEEWREAQKGFNKIWRDQNEKYYLKSLDHLGTNFKQNDVKALRSKALINEIETLFEERNEENANKTDMGRSTNASSGPHLKLVYKSRQKVLDDAADLLIHHAKRQTGITKEDKRRIKTLLRHTVPDLFRHPRQELSEDERENDDDDDVEDKDEQDTSSKREKRKSSKMTNGGRGNTKAPTLEALATLDDDEYTLFLANSHWYVFLRLHHILCERLTKIGDRAAILLQEEKEEVAKSRSRSNGRHKENDSVAVALRLKPKAEVEIDQYYSHFLSMVKNLLDGNIEALQFEDSLREMFGIHAYSAFTLDKVIANAVRQLGHLVTDQTCLQCTEIFLEEHGLKGSSKGMLTEDGCNDEGKQSASEMSYQRRMEQLLADENLFRIVLWHKNEETTIAIEMLDTDTHSSCSGDNPPLQDVRNWSNYVEGYVSDRMDQVMSEKTRRKNTDPSLIAAHSRVRKPVFLQRNLKQWERRRRKDGTAKASRSKTSDVPMDVDDTTQKDVTVSEDAHCVFNVNSYQMVFVANSESVLYKRHAFTRAKQCHKAVTLRMRKQFLAWRERWSAAHVTPEAEKATANWLLGKGDHLELKADSRTVKLVNHVDKRAPFGTLIKYRVDYDKS
ncbi:paired amphipathic helix protein Sin3b-like isoform X1 [Daphnia pulex]|uniref:paired amphipathic helix protein Sin3b-like isoform X1 n=1 Tax=Daphnia pulex TaxID=6669 RepID=UPI001EDDDA6D|nr:paired amphipathic helix protein Sin3b-like isoform X1 [Daphnia pulex]XP_046452721.1 paired amphipathic helix protein Sin3b-like isoform X1 [Daphnia pulex]